LWLRIRESKRRSANIRESECIVRKDKGRVIEDMWVVKGACMPREVGAQMSMGKGRGETTGVREGGREEEGGGGGK
jgi:hypothetical protein